MDKVSHIAAISPALTAIFISTIFLLIVATGIVMLVLIYQKRQIQYLGEKEQLKVNFEREILESKLEIQEQTFKNISQEIHDNIAQILTLAKITINTMDFKDEQTQQEKIHTSSDLIGKAIADLRDLSRSLNADSILRMGLIRSIEFELDLIKRTGRYNTRLTQEGNSYRLPQKEELILFRIFQETINNIFKHSKATEINMSIIYNSANFIMQISDNGIGFNTAALNLNPLVASSGIPNITNRAGVIGADLKIYSEEGKGTNVIITLPYN